MSEENSSYTCDALQEDIEIHAQEKGVTFEDAAKDLNVTLVDSAKDWPGDRTDPETEAAAK